MKPSEKDARFEKTHSEPYLAGHHFPVKSRYQAVRERHGVAALRFEVVKRET